MPKTTVYRKLLTRQEVLKGGLKASGAVGLGAGLSPGDRDTPRSRIEKRNILLITLDTTRADQLGCYGSRGRTSPCLDKVAGDLVLYTRAISPSSWTLPSHASLFTGEFTTSHGAQFDPDGPLRMVDTVAGPENRQKYRARGMAADELTLAMLLKERGYATGAVVAGLWLKTILGLEKGFDFYDDSEISSLNGRIAAQVTGSASNWIERVRPESFFLFLNYYEPHSRYSVPEGFGNEFLPGTSASSKYDAEILYYGLLCRSVGEQAQGMGPL